MHGGCPSPEPGSHWRTPVVQPLLCLGRYEGTDRFRGCRGAHESLSALAITMATEPQEVFGADTRCPYLDRETKTEHVARDERRQDQDGGKKHKNPLLGGVCFLTTGVLIRVRCGLTVCLPVPSTALYRK